MCIYETTRKQLKYKFFLKTPTVVASRTYEILQIVTEGENVKIKMLLIQFDP